MKFLIFAFILLSTIGSFAKNNSTENPPEAHEVINDISEEMNVDFEGKANSTVSSHVFPANKIRYIKFEGHHLDDITIVDSQSDDIELEYTILTDTENVEQGRILSKAIKHQRVGDQLTIKTSVHLYNCFSYRETINGVDSQYVKGACYGNIVVKLPSLTEISVARESEILNNIPERFMNTNILINKLKDSLSLSEHEGLINDFASSREEGFKLNRQELDNIISKLFFSESRLIAFKKLAGFVPEGQISELKGLIDPLFMANDKAEVAKIIKKMLTAKGRTSMGKASRK